MLCCEVGNGYSLWIPQTVDGIFFNTFKVADPNRTFWLLDPDSNTLQTLVSLKNLEIMYVKKLLKLLHICRTLSSSANIFVKKKFLYLQYKPHAKSVSGRTRIRITGFYYYFMRLHTDFLNLFLFSAWTP